MIKCDPRAIARCPFKKQCCGYDVEYFVEGSECDEFNKQLLTQPPTNADRIREMSDEELAEFLSTKLNDDFYDWPDLTLQWLQQPAEGE